ncbi:putative SAP domain containing protein [Leishmania naiffi]|uniref:SAP domain containing protein n=1 Tax=Leishmania naiffi TaxID=5678 RepID=A0AAW3B1Q6_9TRYP
MDPVKRRLVYVADESEALLKELSGTPPTRQSRMTRLLVPLSPPTPSQKSTNSVSPLPRPIDPIAKVAPLAMADTALLVSYDGFLLTDGNGRFTTPRDAAQAEKIRDALKSCRAFLKGFLDAAQAERASTESYSSAASSSTYMEEEDSDLEDSSSDESPPPRQRAATAVKARPPHVQPVTPSQMTVAELKAFLRDRGLLTTGNKESLVKRVQKAQRARNSVRGPATAPACGAASRRSLQGSHSGPNTLSSDVLISPPPAGQRLPQLPSPNSYTNDEKNSGLWDVLVHAGSRLFRGGARTSWGLHSRPPEDADDAPLSKRCRLGTE